MQDETCAGELGAGVPRWDSGACCYGVRDDGSRDCGASAAFYREAWAWGEAWAQACAFGWQREARAFAARRAAVWGLCAKAP